MPSRLRLAAQARAMPLPATWLGHTLETRKTRSRWPAMTRPTNSSEPYNSAVSIRVMPRSMPARIAASSSAGGCLPCASRAEPWPSAGTLRPSRSLTLRAPVGAAPLDWLNAEEFAAISAYTVALV